MVIFVEKDQTDLVQEVDGSWLHTMEASLFLPTCVCGFVQTWVQGALDSNGGHWLPWVGYQLLGVGAGNWALHTTPQAWLLVVESGFETPAESVDIGS